MVLTVVIVLLALGGASLGWTGFGEKKLWDWLQLLGMLAIPVVVALATAWFSSQQSTTQIEVEEQRAQDEALQTYLDQMNNLLLNHNLRNSEEDSEVRTLARARTLTVLARLGPDRKGTVVEFLYEASLIVEPNTVFSIHTADLRGADLSGAMLTGAYLFGVDLTDADLTDAGLGLADLRGANLSGANLSDAFLDDADLGGADLSGADLSNATLDGANLNEADLHDADLRGANLEGAFLLHEANLSGADLRDANLSGAGLIGADLEGADLRGAYLVDPIRIPGLPDQTAVLKDADLSKADLRDVTFTQEQLGQAKTLKGATMPNGQILKSDDNPDGPTFEEWLKSKGRGEDGENDNLS